MPNKPRIVVIGSSNTDMVVKTERIPAPGETVIGQEFVTAAGGKGANQAVAAARLGAEVTFVARIGSDLFGDKSIENFRNEGIDTSFVARDAGSPSGVALISVDKRGENSIVVAPGSNGRLTTADVDKAADTIRSADVIVMQLEVPVEAVVRGAEIAHEAGVPVILNPAPAQELPRDLLAIVDILTPNETEAAILAGESSATDSLGKTLLEIGVGSVVLTLGSRGAMMVNSVGSKSFPAIKAQPVDTTAAGDSFNGALAVAIAEGREMEDAIVFASHAAAISVTRMGAQPSLPTRKEVDASMRQVRP